MTVLSDLRTILAEDVQPSNTGLQLSTGQLERALMQSARSYDSTITSLENLTELEKDVILEGAKGKCYWLLATKTAEAYQTEMDNDKFYLQQMYEHYESMAKQADVRFVEMGGGGGTVVVTDALKRSMGTGKMIPVITDGD